MAIDEHVDNFYRNIFDILQKGRILVILTLMVDTAPESGGGALTREKIVAAVARRFVCIADQSKLVPVLGGFPLPIEVIPMARAHVARRVQAMGGQPRLRAGFVTDNGNHILDIGGLTIDDPVALESAINEIDGVVTVGLFARRGADVLLLGSPEGVKMLRAVNAN